MPGGDDTGRLFVLAGTNGAGKSSVAGEAFRRLGADYFNPDEAARRIREAQPGLSQAEANSAAWLTGKRLLEQAIAGRLVFAFETTLGGRTITSLLERAADDGCEVWMWFVGLDNPERHITRVKARVALGGHDIHETKIRERYEASRRNLIRLLPRLTELRLFDNSVEGDPARGKSPKPLLVLHMTEGAITSMCPPAKVPLWAKPIVAAALRITSRPPLIE